MILSDYLSEKNGLGVLSTANRKGEVNSAVYAKPHYLDNGNVAFIMRDRLTHANLCENPQASFLFVEKDTAYQGIRLSLYMVDQITDPDIISRLARKEYPHQDEKRFFVSFKVEKVLQLVGSEELPIE